MAASQTTRLAIYTWTAGTDTFTRDQMTTSHTNIESRVAGYSQAGSRPAAAAAYQGFFHYSSTDSTAGVLSYSNGTAWFDIGSLSSSTPTPLDGSGSSGSAQSGARSDHKHAISNDAITSAMLNSADGAEAVTSDVIRAGAVDTTALAEDGVTHEKIETSAALSVLGVTGNSTAHVADIAAGTDHHVLRRSGTAVAFGEIATDGIANDAVTAAKLDSTDGSEAVATDTIQDGAVTALKLASDAVTTIKIDNDAVTHEKMEESIACSVLGVTANSAGHVADIQADANDKVLRRYNNALGFGAVHSGGIANGAITEDKLLQTNGSEAVTKATIRNDAVGNDQLDYDEIQLYGKSTSATPAGHKIYANTQSPTDAGVSGSPGDIYLQYTT